MEKYPKGAYIYKEGEPIEYCYLVLKGRVKLIKQRIGQTRSIVLRIVQANELLGIMDFIGKTEVRRCDAMAMDDDTHLLPISFLELQPNLNCNGQLQEALATYFIKVAKDLSFTYENLQLKGSKTKVLRALKKLAQDYGQKTQAGVLIQGFSHQELAEIIGITRQSVSTAMSDLRKSSQISYGRKWILIITN